MLSLTAWIIFALFAAAAVTSFARWRLSSNWEAFWRGVIYTYVAILYAYINSPIYVLLVARYAVRFAFAALVVPHLLENVDAIRRWRKRTQ